MSKFFTKLSKTMGVASLVVTGSAVMIPSAMADNFNYQGNTQGNGYGYGHQPYNSATTTTAPVTTSTSVPTTTAGQEQYRYHTQSPSRYNSYNNGNQYGQYNQNRYANQPQVINGQPQYNYRTAYPTRPAYPAYDRARDYRYGYTSRPQWYGRMHPHEYQVLRRDGRDYYYLQPNIYSTGVVIGRPQPGVVLMQYPDRTLEVIEATRLILDVIAR